MAETRAGSSKMRERRRIGVRSLVACASVSHFPDSQSVSWPIAAAPWAVIKADRVGSSDGRQ